MAVSPAEPAVSAAVPLLRYLLTFCASFSRPLLRYAIHHNAAAGCSAVN
jgi:hypothetical protein